MGCVSVILMGSHVRESKYGAASTDRFRLHWYDILMGAWL